MSAITIKVAFGGPDATCAAWVSGRGPNAQQIARGLLTELRGRAPMWSAATRSWCCQPKTARDLIALAETRRFAVEIVEPEALEMAAGAEVAEERGVLW